MKILGILNITNDSFSDEGKFLEPSASFDYINQMIKDGCKIIDIGAESTRQSFQQVSDDIQIQRIVPVIEYILSHHKDIEISIDTRSSFVAQECLRKGVKMINDVSSGSDDMMFDIIKDHNAEIILTHMPEEHLMGKNMNSVNIINDLTNYFDSKINHALRVGINEEKIIIDPGIGFGKKGNDNLLILNNLELFVKKFKRVCIGVSNKRFSSKIFSSLSDDKLRYVNLAVTTLAAYKRVEFVRVHSISDNYDACKIAHKTLNS